MSDKPKKKITWKQWQRRTMLIILAVVAVFVALYFAVYRQPQPLMEMDCMVGTDAPAAGTITQYSQPENRSLLCGERRGFGCAGFLRTMRFTLSNLGNIDI